LAVAVQNQSLSFLLQQTFFCARKNSVTYWDFCWHLKLVHDPAIRRSDILKM